MQLRLAWRNAWRNPRRTAIVVTAVAIGIAGCLLSMAINLGMVVQMVDTAIATELGHLQVHAPGYAESPALEERLRDGGRQVIAALERDPRARAWARRVRGQGLVNSPRASVGVRVLAVDPAREPGVSSLAESLVAGRWLDGEHRVLLGEALARRLQVDVGDKVVLSVQDLEGDLTGQAFRVGGLFRTPSREVDASVLLLPLDEGQQLFGLGEAVTEIVVVAEDRSAIAPVEAHLDARLGDAALVQSWEELEPLLVHLVETMDASAWYVYAAVFIAMAFGIANVLLMAVYERTREIGMLLALGMRRRNIVVLVVAESLLVTGVGLALGLLLALLGAYLLRGGIDLSAFAEGLTAYGIGTRIVPVLRAEDLGIPIAVAAVVAFVASLWPALRAVMLRPAEALRRL